MADRKEVSDHYKGHEIDFDTAVDRFEIMQEGANPNPSPLDDDTEVELGPKTQPKPNDPYCNC
jgi:hypothetical protein